MKVPHAAHPLLAVATALLLAGPMLTLAQPRRASLSPANTPQTIASTLPTPLTSLDAFGKNSIRIRVMAPGQTALSDPPISALRCILMSFVSCELNEACRSELRRPATTTMCGRRSSIAGVHSCSRLWCRIRKDLSRVSRCLAVRVVARSNTQGKHVSRCGHISNRGVVYKAICAERIYL